MNHYNCPTSAGVEGYRYEGKTNELGQPHGQGIEHYPDGSKIEIEYKDGERHGREIRYYPNGSVRRECGYKDGERHGQRIWYYPDERVRSKTEYKDGKRHGQQIDYHRNGSVRSKTEYKDGVRNSPGIEYYHPDERVRSKIGWKKQEEQGEIVLSPLEEKEKILSNFKMTRNLLVLAVAMIPIMFISWLLMPVDENPAAAWSGLRDEHTPLMLNALEALDVNNCIERYWTLPSPRQEFCQDLVDSTEQEIAIFLILLGILALSLKNVIKKKNEEITQMQDSILEMEEQ